MISGPAGNQIPSPGGEGDKSQTGRNSEESSVPNPGGAQLTPDDWAAFESSLALEKPVARNIQVALTREFGGMRPGAAKLERFGLESALVESRGIERAILQETSGADLLIESPNLIRAGSFVDKTIGRFVLKGDELAGWIGLIDPVSGRALTPVSPSETWQSGSRRVQVKTEQEGGSVDVAETFPLSPETGEPPVVLVLSAKGSEFQDSLHWRFEHRYSASVLSRDKGLPPLIENLVKRKAALGPEKPSSVLAKHIEMALEQEARQIIEEQVRGMSAPDENESNVEIDPERAAIDKLLLGGIPEKQSELDPKEVARTVNYHLDELRSLGYFDAIKSLKPNTRISKHIEGFGSFGLLLDLPLPKLPNSLERKGTEGPTQLVRRRISIELSEGDYGSLQVTLFPISRK